MTKTAEGDTLERVAADPATPPPKYSPFTDRVITVLRRIPAGRVATYSQVAGMAGSPQAARQVVRVLHTLARRERLPWHRVIGSRGDIRLPHGAGFEEQRRLLQKEGVAVDDQGAVDMGKHQWAPRFLQMP